MFRDNFSLTTENGLPILQIEDFRMERRDSVPKIPAQTHNR
jgi:hypothetical protein